MNSEVVIAHISDLHFPHWRGDALQHLKDYLKKKKPLLILVTGDLTDNPNPLQQWRLKRHLNELVESCQEDSSHKSHLVVVPGNHDYAMLGNWNLGLSPLSRSSFRYIFRDYRPRLIRIHIKATDLYVYIFCFNSNPYVARWAKGAISRRQLRWFEKKAHALRSAHKERFESAYKIAILHHHPLPIPFSEELEKFLILNNAGELLRHLAQCKIDLVLHGHKHLSTISSLNMGTSSGTTRKIFVVSSGTTLKKVESENTCNIITIRHPGQAEVTPAGAQPGEKFQDKATVFLPPWDEYIREQYAIQQERLGYEIDELVRELEIDDEGDSITEMKIHGMHITDSDNFKENKVKAESFDIYTETGGLVPEVKFHKSTQAIQPAIVSVGDLHIRGTLGIPDNYDLQSAFSVEIRYLTLNAWAKNNEEFERKYSTNSGAKQEEEWFTCMRPIKMFRQIIHFPKDWKPEGKPSLRILSSKDGENFSPESESYLERHHADALNYNEKSNSITLTINRPLYGFRYIVGWFLPQSQVTSYPTNPHVETLIEEMRSAPDKLDDLLKALNELVCSSIAEVIVGKRDDEVSRKRKDEIADALKNEPIDISIAIPSKEATGDNRLYLEIIAYNLNLEGIKNFRFPVGEGVAGRAYKLNSVRTYIRRSGSRRYYDLVKEDFIYVPFIKSNDHWVLYSIPLRHPRRPDLLVGVLTVGSRKNISRLIPISNTLLEQMTNALIDIAGGYVVKRLSDLYGNILEI